MHLQQGESSVAVIIAKDGWRGVEDS